VNLILKVKEPATPAVQAASAARVLSRAVLRRRLLQAAVQSHHVAGSRSNSAPREANTPIPARKSPSATQPLFRVPVRKRKTTRPESKRQLAPGTSHISTSHISTSHISTSHIIYHEPIRSAILITPSKPVDNRFSSSIPITELLRLSQQGDTQAGDHLFRVVFGQLRRIAAANLRREHHPLPLQPTELVNEAYVHLFGNREKDFQNREHFFRVAARAMRCVLADIARKRNATKRMDGLIQVPLDEAIPDSRRAWPEKVLMFEEALLKLAQMDSRAAEIVELKVFLGLTDQQVSDNLGYSVRTVKRDFKAAKAWLQAEMSPISSKAKANAARAVGNG
jgi:RNA polymerase sigma factor (TIGR02999 family)